MDFDFNFTPTSSARSSGSAGSPGSDDDDSFSPPGGGNSAQAAERLLAPLNERQKEAVLATDGPLIVLAGAGSGKTKMLTSRIAYLIDVKRVAPWQILAVTFTNKAAAEMRDRVSKLLGESSMLGQPEIGTFHSVCVRILRREAGRTPFKQQFVIYDDSDQLSLIKSAVQRLGIDEKAFSPKSLQGAINRAKCDAISPEDLEPAPHNLFDKQLKRVYAEYQKDLFANNAIDFGEIITLTYRLLRDNEDIRDKYQRRFRYLHVDEYQDTNRAQYLLLQLLASRNHGGHENICVVGDEDQSIYKWRGADIRNILDFEKDYPGSQIVKLEQNYRSTKSIIAAAAHVIRNNRERKDKTLWTDNEQGTQIVRFQLPDERAESEIIVSEIKRLCTFENRGYQDFAIFYRTHAQSRSFEDVFRREKIPYAIVGGLKFYDRKEIKDILAYFRCILNPTDSVSLKRVVNVPARGIGKTTLDKVEELYNRIQAQGLHQAGMAGTGADDVSYWGALRTAASDSSVTSAGTAKKLAGFVQLMQRLMDEQPRMLLSDLYHLILDETGYVRELRQEATDESQARIENLEEFDNLLKEFEDDWEEALKRALEASDATATEEQFEAAKKERIKDLLATFLEQSTLASDADLAGRGMTGGGSITMMTLHSSKGLEYPVVFLPGMEEGLFPSVRAWEETTDEEIEEERRLCYVGMTRAREQLYLSSVAVRRIWGETNYQEPARFFAEIPDELVDFRDLSRGPAAANFRPGSSRSFGNNGYSEGSSFGETTKIAGLPPRNRIRPIDDDVSQVAPSGALSGRAMNHPEYGMGRVISVDGSGTDARVTIEFRNRQQRKFLLRFVESFFDVD